MQLANYYSRTEIWLMEYQRSTILPSYFCTCLRRTTDPIIWCNVHAIGSWWRYRQDQSGYATGSSWLDFCFYFTIVLETSSGLGCRKLANFEEMLDQRRDNFKVYPFKSLGLLKQLGSKQLLCFIPLISCAQAHWFRRWYLALPSNQLHLLCVCHLWDLCCTNALLC